MASLRSSLCIVIIGMLILMTTAFVNAQTPDTKVQSVLVFPLDNDANTENSQAATDIASALADGLGANSDYHSVMYSSRLPFVQRLVATNPQKKISTSGPFVKDAKALADAYSISDAAGVDLAIVGSLNRYEQNEANAFVANTTIQVLDVNKKMIKQTFIVSATSETAAGVIGSIAAKIIEQITGKAPAIVPSPAPNDTAAVQPSPQTKRTAVMVPFAYPISEDEAVLNLNKMIARQFQMALEKGIENDKLFSVIRYTVQTPAILRASKEGKIKAQEVTSPTDTTIAGALKARKIANLIGTQSSILGSIDNSSITDDAVNITATVQVVSSRTGKVDNSIVINGSAAKTGNETQKDMITKAISDAVAKIIKQLRGPANK